MTEKLRADIRIPADVEDNAFGGLEFRERSFKLFVGAAAGVESFLLKSRCYVSKCVCPLYQQTRALAPSFALSR